jgi:hypothetical protein
MSIERTAMKNVWTSDQCATRTTIANAQNWRIAPCESTAIGPRMQLYATTLRVLDAPARLRPSAIRVFTGSAIDVPTTAFTSANMFSAPTYTITTGKSSLRGAR